MIAKVIRFPDGAREKIEVGEYVACPNCGAEVIFNLTGYICFSLKCNGNTTVKSRVEKEPS